MGFPFPHSDAEFLLGNTFAGIRRYLTEPA